MMHCKQPAKRIQSEDKNLFKIHNFLPCNWVYFVFSLYYLEVSRNVSICSTYRTYMNLF